MWAHRREAMESGANARWQQRLVERGSDRLAFITGQPSECGIGGDKFSNIIQLQKSEPSDLVPEIQPTGEPCREKPKDETQSNEGDLLQKSKTSSAAPEIQPVNEIPLRRHDDETLSKEISNDGAASAHPRREMETRHRSVPPNPSNQAENAAWSVENPKEHLNFTPHEITQAITATECNRFVASTVVAFLVVLSNWGLDIGGTITRVLVCTRPLLFLIITNITIVLTFLMENKDHNARGRPAGTSLGSADSLGQMLEVGLLLQNALGAELSS